MLGRTITTCAFSSAPAALRRRGTPPETAIGQSKRQEMKVLLRQLKETNPNIEKSIFRAIHGVQLDTFPGFKYRGRPHSFLENYDGTAYCEDI